MEHSANHGKNSKLATYIVLGVAFGQMFTLLDADFGFRCRFWANFSIFRYGFWVLFVSTSKSSQAEVDYVIAHRGMVLPVEIKASRQGSMQSLWIFMRQHNLHDAIRSSLEPFGEFVYYDPKAGDAERHVDIIPLYALSNIAVP